MRSTPTVPADLVVAEDVLGRAAGQEHRVDVVVCTYHARGAALEERRLPQRDVEPLLDEDLLRRLDVREARRVEDDARLEADLEAAEPAEEVRALPADEPVNVGLQGVELEAAARRIARSFETSQVTVSGTTPVASSSFVSSSIVTDANTPRSSSAWRASSRSSLE